MATGRNDNNIVQSTKTEPGAYALPAIEHVYDEARNLYDTAKQSTPGPTTREAQGLIASLARQPSPALSSAGKTVQGLLGEQIAADPRYGQLFNQAGGGGALDYLTPTARGDYLNQPDQHLETIINDTSDSIRTRLAAEYGAAGRYGGGSYNEDLINRLYANEAGLRSGAYQTERDRQMSAASALEAAQQGRMGMQRGLLGDAVGQELTGRSQQLSAASLAPTIDASRYAGADRLAALGAEQDASVYDPLNRLASLIYPGAGFAQTTTTSEPGPTGFQKFLGGASAIGGLLGPFLSDERVKTDVKKVGKTNKGLNVVTYRFKDEPSGAPKRMGLIAQEVHRKQPRAAKRLPGGLLGVDLAEVA